MVVNPTQVLWMRKKIVTTTRYKILPNFPKEIIDNATIKFEKEIGYNNIEDYPKHPNTIQPHLKMAYFPFDINLEGFKPFIIFLMSPPNSGMGIPHVDKSRKCCINIPIRVNPERGDYIAGRFDNLDMYPKPQLFNLNGKTGLKYEYDKKYFENVRMEYPIFANTSLPHSWINDDDNYRVIAGLYFIDEDIKNASKIAEQWI